MGKNLDINEEYSDGDVSRREVLKGAGAVGAGMIGANAATGSAKGGAVSGGCIIDWPDPLPDRINIEGGTPNEEGNVPQSGDIVVFIHGLFSENIIDSINLFNGANQAAAFDQALSNNNVDTPVVAGMWDSTHTWSVAKERADQAAVGFANWVESNEHKYDSITVFGHSLGSRVVLQSLQELAKRDLTINSAALLGAGVNPDTVCSQYAHGIEHAVEDNVYDYHSEGDRIVCWAYAALEWTSGLGCEGADCSDTPENYVGVNLSGVVDGHCNFYKPDDMISKGQSGVPDMVIRQFDVDEETVNPGDGGSDDGLLGGGGPGFTLPAMGAALGGAGLLSRYRSDD